MYEETLALIDAYGSLREILSEQSKTGNRDRRLADAVEQIADYLAAAMVDAQSLPETAIVG